MEREHIPLIALSVSIIGQVLTMAYFIIGQATDRRKRRENIQIEAYYKMTYGRASDNIDSFIKETEALCEQCVKERERGDQDSYAKSLLDFGEKKRRFELGTIDLYRLRYPAIAEKMAEIVRDIEDAFASDIENIIVGNLTIADFVEKIYRYRISFCHYMLLPIEDIPNARKYPWEILIKKINNY